MDESIDELLSPQPKNVLQNAECNDVTCEPQVILWFCDLRISWKIQDQKKAPA